ncbi:MAG: DNA translocase FtsK 4TM domain-containing protein [Pseudomonadota bacterium]
MHTIPGPLRGSTGRDYAAIVLVAGAAFLLLCLVSHDPKDPSFNVATNRSGVSNLCGLVGSHVADALVQLMGLSAIAVPLGFLIQALRLFMPSPSSVRWTEVCSLILILSGTSALLERFELSPAFASHIQYPGGALGVFLHDSFFRLLGSAGEILLCITLLSVSVLHLSRISVSDVSRLASSAAAVPVRMLNRTVQGINERRIARKKAAERSLRTEEMKSGTPVRKRVVEQEAASVKNDAVTFPEFEPDPLPWNTDEYDIGSPDIHSWKRISFLPEDTEKSDEGPCPKRPAPRAGQDPPEEKERGDEGAYAEMPDQDEDPDASEEMLSAPLVTPEETQPLPAVSGKKADDSGRTERPDPPKVTPQELEAAIEQYLREEISPAAQCPAVPPVQKRETCGNEEAKPIRVTKRADEDLRIPGAAEKGRPEELDDFKLPPSDFLDEPDTSNRSVDEKLLEQNARILEQKLADLKITGEVVEVHPGPVITMYELTLAPGIPLRKILSTSDDLAMALKCGSTRVVAPIPGKDTVGIEVPNANREIVYFREIIESPAFRKSTSPLKIAMGKNIDGEPFATSLARMPHLLIAGATGTGKSVGLNCLICSLLMSSHPDDVKFLMVDPKKLELSYYQDIPHLLHPVVTDPDKVPKVLSWAIREMERRYDLLSAAGAKNIEGYNKKVLAGQIASGSEDLPASKLPYLVIIVDELAELMMVAAKDIEISIARLAQMARAAGIHLVLATQRPSVDVITGVIKANLPARISFQVSAKPDSRTILDTTGAEHLLGMGDMLFLPPGTSKMRRIHGAFVSENEISKIVDHIKAQRSPVYLKEIANHVAEDESKAAAGELIDDEKYDEAVDLITRLGHASISLIQRHMRIGYNRAARIIEAMESEGIIGPSDGTSRPREVLARSLSSVQDGPA